MKEKNISTPLHGSNIKRQDVPEKYKWHIKDIYNTENDWKDACQNFKAKLTKLDKLHGKLSNTASLIEALTLQAELAQVLEKIYAYARLQQDADNTDQHFQSLAGEAETLATKFSSAVAFIEPELINIGKDNLEKLANENTQLTEYKFYFSNLMRLAEHILSADKEALLAQSQLATSNAASAFRALVSADLKFPKITDGYGKETTISEGNYLLNMTSDDRTLRKNSFCALMGTYHNFRNTLATTLTGNSRSAFFKASVHKYNDTLEAALSEDNIPISLYNGLIDTVHDNLKPLHEYIQLKKEILGYSELHMYDMYMPLAKNAADTFSYSFEEACKKVEAALKPLGEKYLSDLHQGFTNGWIDAYENKGKRSGAYSWGVYGVHPYVLLNYQPRYNSISTIAHEMGHAMHSYYSSQAQTYINSDYTIFCAEVASTTNENLLLEYMLKEANKEQKIYLLNQFLEAVRTTVYRQVQFAEFEKFIHNEITAGKSLQAEVLENYWLDLNRKYYGEALTIDQELASEWSRIPHFYTPFYVYKYATGYSAATAFSSYILQEKENALEKYLGFLHAGGSDYSLNILKTAGVDLTTPQPVNVTLNKFASKIQELKNLLNN